MAKPDLWSCIKFKRLCRNLNIPRPYIVGLLETLWQSAYATSDCLVGDSDDVECAAEWPGNPGILTDALVEARFLDKDGELYYIHDLVDHAPEYVQKRLIRRKNKDLQKKTAENGEERRKMAENGGLPSTPNPPTNTNGGEYAPPTPRFSDADVRKVLDAYPLRQGLPHAHHACRQVILELARRGDADPVGKLIGIVQAYAASDVVKRGKTWSALNFFTGHWEDDPATWADRKPPPAPADPKDKYGFEVPPDNNDPLPPEAWKEINETNELFNKDRRRRDAEWRAIIAGGKQARPATGTGDGGDEVPREGVPLPVP